MVEEIIEPDLPIIDAHHHLWYAPRMPLAATGPESADGVGVLARIYNQRPRYLFDDMLADAMSGHNVRATVYIEVHAMYRSSGPAHLRSVGEIEFANGMAAMADSGAFGDVKICAGIIGGIDLRIGDAAAEILQAQMKASGRYRGIRAGHTGYDERLPNLVRLFGSKPGTLRDPQFRQGFRHLEAMGLVYEAFQFEPQLPDVLDLARAFPNTQIVLNHCGMPMGVGWFAGRHEERFPVWRKAIQDIAACSNVVVKLGGLGNPMCGFPSSQQGGATSEQLAKEWRPYIETCIEAFGVDRCMFESNFPVDSISASYGAVWNAFKRIVRDASATEKAALFYNTAVKVYRLDI
jgi:predicted TIM-barrel fold metal-dependent hydrolase